MRYRAAVGVGEEAHSRQRHWCPWSKSVNVETWGHVPDPIVMAHTFAELGKGTMARAAPCSTQPKRIATVHIVKPLALCRRPAARG